LFYRYVVRSRSVDTERLKMGKIVKFCNTCDEGFAEKFGFCPNCGQTLQTFEMNPVVPEAPAVQEVVAAAPVVAEVMEPVASPVEIAQEVAPAAATVVEPVVDAPVIEEPVIAQQIKTPVAKAPKAAAATVAPFVQKTVVDVDRKPAARPTEHKAYVPDDGFNVTVIEEKNVGQRRVLLLGAFSLMIFALMTGMVYNLFSKDLNVGSINDDIFNAVIVDDIPATVEEEVQQKKDKDGGGGGGGGRDEKEETTQGDLADQAKNPTRPPDAKVPRANFELVTPPPQTEGDRKFEKKFDRWGDPNGRFASFSNGTGTGGGQGSGVGTGQGSGRGTGTGSGIGSGSGSGLGSGNGSGLGPGGNSGDDNPPPPRPVGVTQPLKILSKPKASYTDAARTNNIQGVVLLRVVFSASGQVGSISTVKGLPNGLTEQAIAAARSIRFEPAKVDGVPRSVTKTMEFSFSIY
jgi:periplasmic protein TonB